MGKGRDRVGTIQKILIISLKREAYGLYPMGSGKKISASRFKWILPLKMKVKIYWAESCLVVFSKLKLQGFKGTKFKISYQQYRVLYLCLRTRNWQFQVMSCFPIHRSILRIVVLQELVCFQRIIHSLLPDIIRKIQDFMAIIVTKTSIDYIQLWMHWLIKAVNLLMQRKIHEAFAKVRRFHQFNLKAKEVQHISPEKHASSENAVKRYLEIDKTLEKVLIRIIFWRIPFISVFNDEFFLWTLLNFPFRSYYELTSKELISVLIEIIWW